MFYVLQYPNFTAYDYAARFANRDDAVSSNPVFNWLIFGKLPESQTADPAYYDEYFRPSGQNRYIAEFTVKAIPVNTLTTDLAVGGTMTITNTVITNATSADEAIATVTVTDGVATITGVAAGTTTITIKDRSNDNVYIITVTVA
jgi:uncharacterized protein YjdB